MNKENTIRDDRATRILNGFLFIQSTRPGNNAVVIASAPRSGQAGKHKRHNRNSALALEHIMLKNEMTMTR